MTNDRKSLGLFLSSMLIFGTVGVLRRYIPLPSALLAFTRGVLGGLFLLVFVLLRKKKGGGEKLPKGVFWPLAATGAMIGINWILLFEAYNHTTVAVATLCYYMQPTIVILLSPLVFRERLTGRKAACAAVAVLGMALVSGVFGSGGQGASLRGVLLGLGAACFYAGVVLLSKKLPPVDAYRRTTVLLLSAGLVMLPYLLLTGGFAVGDFNVTSALLLLVLGVVHTGVAYTLYFSGMDGLRTQTIAVFSYVDPVAALLFSALLLREPLSLTGVVGAALILGSAVVSELEPPEKGSDC